MCVLPSGSTQMIRGISAERCEMLNRGQIPAPILVNGGETYDPTSFQPPGGFFRH